MNKPLTVYLGCPMTGYDKEQMVSLATHAEQVLKKYGIKSWSPVLAEGVAGKGSLDNKNIDLDWKWPMDKGALNKSWAFINLRADEKSFGCEDEYGRHRYSEWQPVVRISPKHASGYVSIANYQTDIIAKDIEEAAFLLSTLFGTWRQRFIWKVKLIIRSGPKWLWRQLTRLGQ